MDSSQPRALRWETLTKKQFDGIDRSRAVVLVPCSPLAVHGPHLPLGPLRFAFLNPLLIRLTNGLIGMRIPIA